MIEPETPYQIINWSYRVAAGVGLGVFGLSVLGYAWMFGGFFQPLLSSLLGLTTRVWGGGRRKLAAVNTSSKIETFFTSRIFPHLTDVVQPTISVEWVNSVADLTKVVERSSGQFIVRLRHESVPEYNQLVTLMACIPNVFFPHAWPHFSTQMRAAIELHIAGMLAESLGGRALRFYSTELLAPALQRDSGIGEMLDQLSAIEQGGLFEAILLQELVGLSDRLIRSGNPDIASECADFVSWLQRFANRALGSEQELLFIRKNLQLALLLAARHETAAFGTSPYGARMRRNVFAGARNVYLIGLTRAHHDFAREIVNDVKDDAWVSFLKSSTPPRAVDGTQDSLYIAQFKRNDSWMSGRTFRAVAQESGVEIGTPVEAVVRDVGGALLQLRTESIDLVVQRHEVACGFRGVPSMLFEEGMSVRVTPISIDEQRCVVFGTLRRELSDWHSIIDELVPGRTYEVEVVGVDGDVHVRLKTKDEDADADAVYGVIDAESWSVFTPSSGGWEPPYVGMSFHAVLVSRAGSRNLVALSRAHLEQQDWDNVVRRYPKGTRSQAVVVRTDADGVVCELAPRVFGRIKAERMQLAGYEFARFQESLPPGVKLDIVVVGVKMARQFFQLDLARNMSR